MTPTTYPTALPRYEGDTLAEADAQETRDLLNALTATTHSSEDRYRHWTKALVYTQGVAEMAEIAGAYWLIDLIASHQHKPKVRAERLQMWTLAVNPQTRKAGVVCSHDIEDGEPYGILATQNIPYCDFPLASFKLYLADGVLMLPSEY